MSGERFTDRLLVEAVQIVERRDADDYVQRAIEALCDGRAAEPLDALVVAYCLTRAQNTAEGRRMLGLSRTGRGKSARLNPIFYFPGSPVHELVRRFSLGEVNRSAARVALAEHIGDANMKTLNGMLDSLCRRFGFPLPR